MNGEETLIMRAWEHGDMESFNRLAWSKEEYRNQWLASGWLAGNFPDEGIQVSSPWQWISPDRPRVAALARRITPAVAESLALSLMAWSSQFPSHADRLSLRINMLSGDMEIDVIRRTVPDPALNVLQALVDRHTIGGIEGLIDHMEVTNHSQQSFGSELQECLTRGFAELGQDYAHWRSQIAQGKGGAITTTHLPSVVSAPCLDEAREILSITANIACCAVLQSALDLIDRLPGMDIPPHARLQIIEIHQGDDDNVPEVVLPVQAQDLLPTQSRDLWEVCRLISVPPGMPWNFGASQRFASAFAEKANQANWSPDAMLEIVLDSLGSWIDGKQWWSRVQESRLSADTSPAPASRPSNRL